jgi:regulator of protease activity HflC (stomatin/prohibitin superfamily)
MLREKQARGANGWLMLFLLLALLIGFILLLVQAARGKDVAQVLVWTFFLTATVVCLSGFAVVNPNESVVALLFGNYIGSIKQAGFWWLNPFATKKHVSLRVRNFETAKLKVNDHDGNPIEIAAVVVWQVVETAEAMFNVDDYQNFVHVQSEAAVRNLATSYPYDAHQEGQMSLRGNTAEIAGQMRKEIQDRLERAGVVVVEARISHLAYAPEIANAMLRRQQASAVIAARQKIVEGAVGMVEMALEMLASKRVIQLDEERKAAMVSNLLVVLCGDRDAQPIVNTGTIYQ